MANSLDQLTEDQSDIGGENPLRRVYIYGDDQRPEAADEVPYADNYLTQRVAPQPGANLVQDVLALVRQAQEYLTPKYESTGGQRSRSPIVNEVFDTLTTDRPGKPRLQLWPERMVRSGLALPGDVMSGRVPVIDPETGHTSSELIERAQDTAGLAVPGALIQRPGTATLGSGPVRAVKPEMPAPVFYSALEHAATNAAQDTMSPQQWLGWLKNQPGVKGEELAWTGLGDWLGAQKGKVSKADVQRYLDEHKVEIKDVTKRSDQTTGLDNGRFTIEENPRGGGYRVIDNEQSAVVDTFQTRPEAEQALVGYRDDPNFKDVYSDTKYSGYQLPGGENYREHLLTLPEKLPKPTQVGTRWTVKVHDRGLGDTGLWDTPEQARRAAEKLNLNQNSYRSSHWDEPNVLAHVRTNDRDVGGVPSLHIEEIQSDWHQQGRKQGYKDEVKTQEARNNLEKSKMAFDDYLTNNLKLNARAIEHIKMQLGTAGEREHTMLLDQLGRLHGDKAKELGQNFVDALVEKDRHVGSSKAPDAPFKTSWAELALKRMVRMAAEEGKTRVSWTPGEAQAARYDLSKTFDEITAHKIVHKGKEFYDLTGVQNTAGSRNNHPLSPMGVPAEKLSDYVGKELAEKIAGQDPGVKSYKGLDLKVGGEGMKGFYDNMLPKMVEKLGKAHGVKVKKDLVPVKEINRTVDDRFSVTGDKRIFNTVEEAKKAASEPVYYFDIPPAWSDQAVSKGFPLFMSGIPFPLTPVDFDPFKKDK